MRKRSIIGIILSIFLLMGSIGQAWASSTQQQISDAKDKQEETKSSLEKTQEMIKALEAKKGQSEVYLNELNTQLSSLKAELEELQNAYDEKQAELEQLQSELEIAKADEQEQYEAMKIRIQYMYENSISDNIAMLFNSGSITEFLNQAENISKMTEYDRDRLNDYTETKEYIEQKEAEVSEEKAAIVKLQEECVDKQDAVGELIQATYNQIREYQANIAAQESAESALLRQIDQQQEEINALLKKAKEEEAARLLAEKKAAEEKAAAEAAAAAKEAAKKAAAEKAAAEAAKKAAEEKAAAEKAAAEAAAAEKAAAEAAAKAATEAAAKAEAEREAAEKAAEEAAKKAEEEKAEAEKEESSNSQGTYLGRFKLTAYCACTSCCGAYANGITASGTVAKQGRTIAMAGVPFGTKLSINGTVYTVEDRGTAYGHIDVFMSSHSAALQFGVKYADVYRID